MKSKIDNEPHAQREKNLKKPEISLPKLADSCRGWLKNGNPPGDPTQAPRCNARTKRTGALCRQPAMANGRCRLHGGKSTGPKTPKGLERSRKANHKHGFHSAGFKSERKSLAALLREAKDLLRGM